jgi:hypothetical protein
VFPYLSFELIHGLLDCWRGLQGYSRDTENQIIFGQISRGDSPVQQQQTSTQLEI